MALEPIRFNRPAPNKLLGAFAYIIAVPLLGLTIAILAGGIVLFLVHALTQSEAAGLIAGVVVAPTAFVAFLIWAFRNYRRRAFTEVVIYDDRIEIRCRKEQTVIPYSDIRAMRLEHAGSSLACTFITDDDRRVSLPPGIASFESVGPVLEARLTPILVRRIDDALAAGRSAACASNTVHAWCTIALGVLLGILGLIAAVVLRFQILPFAVQCLRQGARGRRGGFEIAPDGLIPPGNVVVRAIPWNEVTLTKLDKDGVVLATIEGHTASAPVTAENFCAFSNWLRTRLATAQSP